VFELGERIPVWGWGFSRGRERKRVGEVTLSTLFPTTILTTDSDTYVSSSEYHRGSASKDSRFETSYTKNK
jgi:hypothetical protein